MINQYKTLKTNIQKTELVSTPSRKAALDLCVLNNYFEFGD